MSIESLADEVLGKAEEERLAHQYAVVEASIIDSALFSFSSEMEEVIRDARTRFNVRLRAQPSIMLDELVRVGTYGWQLSRTRSRPHIQITITLERGRYCVEVSGVKNNTALPLIRYVLKLQNKWPTLHNGDKFVSLPEFAEKLIEYFV